jgi:cation transport ATPase
MRRRATCSTLASGGIDPQHGNKTCLTSSSRPSKAWSNDLENVQQGLSEALVDPVQSRGIAVVMPIDASEAAGAGLAGNVAEHRVVIGRPDFVSGDQSAPREPDEAAQPAGARGTAAASEVADVIVLVDRLEQIAEAILIARQTRKIAIQRVAAGLGLSFVGIIAAAHGYLTPIAGALVQEGIDVAMVANALLALRGAAGAGERMAVVASGA